MRARGIKPGFYKNEELAECSFPARLLYPGLWMMADRAGRMEYRPKRIKAELFPFDSIETAPLLDELERHGLIKKYEVRGCFYLWIPGFSKHQNPHKHEKASALPPHPDEMCTDFQGEEPESNHTDSEPAPEQHSTSTVQTPEQHPSSTVPLGLTPDSCFLIPEETKNKTPGSTLRARDQRGGDCEISPGESSSASPPTETGTEPGIDFLEIREFYDSNARREAPFDGYTEFKQAIAGRYWPGHSRFYQAVSDLAEKDEQWRNGFAPGLAKFIRTRGWEKRPATNSAQPQQARCFDDYLREKGILT